jgi:DNA-binding transcriptional LysR family regulator
MKNDLSKLNLNLLIALDALLKEQNVTLAGKRLHITQSAMSNLLKQLRGIFQDELFIRGQASQLIATPYALQLKPRLTEALEKISSVFQAPERFYPEKSKTTFTIGFSDYTELVLLPDLVRCIIEQAPEINIVIKHINYIKSKNIFEYDDIDLAIGIYSSIPETLIAQPLFTDKSVCVGDRKNPLLKNPIDGKHFAQAKHIVVSYFENKEELRSEQYLKKSGLKRKTIVTIPHTVSALYCVARTDLVVLVLERVARKFTKILPIAYQNITFTQATVAVQMVWHPRNKNNPAHIWLRETVIEVAKKLDNKKSG